MMQFFEMRQKPFYLHFLACIASLLLVVCAKATSAPTDIQFVLNDTYKVGEKIEVKIRNVGKVPYAYNQEYPACDLSYFDESGRKFIIPPGTHCDLVVYAEIKPGETKTLFEWDLSECIEDRWGCVKSKLLPEGTYTIKSQFDTSPEGGRRAKAVATIKIIK